MDRNNVSMYVGMRIFEQFFARIDAKVKCKCYQIRWKDFYNKEKKKKKKNGQSASGFLF